MIGRSVCVGSGCRESDEDVGDCSLEGDGQSELLNCLPLCDRSVSSYSSINQSKGRGRRCRRTASASFGPASVGVGLGIATYGMWRCTF